MLHNKTGAGNDFVGWVDLPVNYDREEFASLFFSQLIKDFFRLY